MKLVELCFMIFPQQSNADRGYCLIAYQDQKSNLTENASEAEILY